MKKQLALATAALMALSLAACGSTATASSAAESTSTAASSEAASTDSTAADDGDVLQQAAAAAFANDVTLTMWGAEEDQELLRTIADNFIKEYGNYGGKITINLGAQSEKEAKDTVLTDPTAAADVYAFADDQLNELVQAGALQEVQLNADDIKSRNTAASVDAATLNGKLKDGTLVAGVNGTWRANDAAEVWGDNYAACKLPTYTLNGEQVQMASFSGFKLIGVNPHSANVGAAMLLADYVTNEENETLRFQQRAQGPSNTNALAAASSPALTAVVAQSEYANLQRVGGNYWASAETLGQICVNGNPDGKDPQTLIEDAVAGITAPVTQ